MFGREMHVMTKKSKISQSRSKHGKKTTYFLAQGHALSQGMHKPQITRKSYDYDNINMPTQKQPNLPI
jgi:hypothetical protein